MPIINYKFRILKKTRETVTVRIFGNNQEYYWDDFEKIFEVHNKIYAIFNPNTELKIIDHSADILSFVKVCQMVAFLQYMGGTPSLEQMGLLGSYSKMLDEIFPIWSFADQYNFCLSFKDYLNKEAAILGKTLEEEEKKNSPVVEIEQNTEAVQKSGRTVKRDVIVERATTCMADVKGADALMKLYNLEKEEKEVS